MLRQLALVTVLAAGFVLPLASPAGRVAAQEATPSAASAATPAILPPDEPAYGLTLGEWVGRQFQWEISFPASANPATDETGERCGWGQSGPVFFLAPVLTDSPTAARTCAVPAGAAVLLPLFATACSTVEPPPYFGRDEAELRACAAAEVDAFDPAATMAVALDGAAVPDLERYRVQTPPVTVAFPADNLYGLEPGVGTALLDGYALLFAPLPAGEHELRFSFALPDGTPAGVTYLLAVEEPAVVEPAAEATPAGGGAKGPSGEARVSPRSRRGTDVAVGSGGRPPLGGSGLPIPKAPCVARPVLLA